MMGFIKKYFKKALIETIDLGLHVFFIACVSGFGFTVGVLAAIIILKS